jgi:hypothetical protein
VDGRRRGGERRAHALMYGARASGTFTALVLL